MAHLHVKTPGGTTYSIDLDTINANGGSIPDSGNNGWGVLTNGAILQWGIFISPLDGPGIEQSFPISFHNACFAACATTTPHTFEGGDSVSVTKSTILLDPYDSRHANAYVIAIGY